MIFKLRATGVIFAVLSLFPPAAYRASAQINIPSIINVLTDPSGVCLSPGTPLQYNTQLNHLSACQGASPGPYSWSLVSSGGGGSGTVTSITAGSCLTGGTITTSGTIALNGAVNPESATYQVLASDFSGCKTIFVNGGTFNITLVISTSQPANGQFINIINSGSGTLTIVRSGQNINGGTSSIVLGPGSATNPSAAFVISDGTNYFASAGSAFPATTCTSQFLSAIAIGGAGTCSSLTTGELPAGTTQTIASGATALGTSSISSGACATVVTATATGTAATDAIIITPNASIKALTGYTPATTGGLTIAAYPTSNTVNIDVCNWSNGSITPSALTLNWRVVR